MTPSTVLAALLSLVATPHDRALPPEDRAASLALVADAIASAAKTRRDVAILLTLGEAETHFDSRVVLGRCDLLPRGSCDWDRKSGVFRARGPWQLHAGTCPAAWALPPASVESLRAEASCALRLFKWAERRCIDTFKLPGEAGAFATLAGMPECQWAGAQKRAARLRVLTAKGHR